MSTYEGWSTQETWAVNLYVMNDEPIYKRLVAHIEKYAFAGLEWTPGRVAFFVARLAFNKITFDSPSLDWDCVNWEEIAADWNLMLQDRLGEIKAALKAG